MRDRSAFVPCRCEASRCSQIPQSQFTPSSAQKRSGPSKEALFCRVASAAASASLRSLPRYLPWQRRDALHPSAPDPTRVARLDQCFLKHRVRELPATDFASRFARILLFLPARHRPPDDEHEKPQRHNAFQHEPDHVLHAPQKLFASMDRSVSYTRRAPRSPRGHADDQNTTFSPARL